jgi:hypothetical protein
MVKDSEKTRYQEPIVGSIDDTRELYDLTQRFRMKEASNPRWSSVRRKLISTTTKRNIDCMLTFRRSLF